MKKAKIVILIIAVLLLAAVAGGLYAGFTITNGDTNLNNVYIGDIAVGKLTRQQTKQALDEAKWDEKVSTPFVVATLGGVEFELEPVKTGFVLSADDAVDAAFAYGHDEKDMLGNLVKAVKLLFSPVDVTGFERIPDSDYINSRISDGLELLDDYMGEEEYVIDQQAETMTMKKGWGQIEIDPQAMHDAIVQAFTDKQTELNYTTINAEPKMPDFDALHKELEREPVDASYTDDGKFEVIDEVVGCKFDVAEAEKLWNGAQPGDEIVIPMDITWPEVTGEFLRGQLYRDLLGACMTKFPASGEPRRNNLELATSKISGLILYPGDEFSYNTVVGVRTEEAGFLPAPAYVDGDVKDELGGGACQVSSTLYAATAFAFLETVERECHYFPVNYMQMGSDATVTIPEGGGRSIDFKFRNNKNYPVKLVGIFNNEESTLTFEVWGTLEETDWMPVEFDNSYSWQFDYHKYIDPAYPDRDGYAIKLSTEIYSFSDDVGPGYRTLTHRQVIDMDGNIVHDEIINKKLSNGNYAMDTYYQH